MRRFILLLAFVVLWATPAHAVRTWTERYVDCENGSDASDGTSEVNAWLTIQKCADTATAGMRCNIEYDGASQTCTLAASIDMDTNNGSADNPIIFQGYSATVGDGTYAVVDGNSAATNIFNFNSATGADYVILRHLELKGSTADAVTSNAASDSDMMLEIKITQAGGDGVDLVSGAGSWNIVGSEIGGTTTIGVDANNGFNLLYNYIHDTGGDGVEISAGANNRFFSNVIDTTAGHGIDVSITEVVILQNTIYNSTGAGNDNINFTSADEEEIVMNNILNTAADYNLDINAGNAIHIYASNDLAAGTTGSVDDATLIITAPGTEQTADPQFTNAGGADFSIGANLDELGYPTTYLGSGTTAHREIGAVMYEETSGGTGGGTWGF